MTDITAYIGEPDMKEALDAIRLHRPEWTAYVSDPLIVEFILDAALAGMETVTLSEETKSNCSYQGLDTGCLCEGRSRRLVGPWEPVEE